ncbi:hypothetical protein LXM94_22490 [Rhizobium sp. TRM95111]|uniref:hypothetical protein n=1 Tax=Rhizobium alarense TaxID=2846851 RepID=UPI001F1A376A|nr:hypothetical protein [Rhizobium alarense]MCF3642741.1 hypothetical protein [Rhizobium alarense]
MLSHLRPDNQNHPQGIDRSDGADHQTLTLLQQERDKALKITNYLEALHAKLLAEIKGGTVLVQIIDKTSREAV